MHVCPAILTWARWFRGGGGEVTHTHGCTRVTVYPLLAPPPPPRPPPSDFYEYFHAAGELLDLDDSLYAVSAWNDNGYRQMVTSKCVTVDQLCVCVCVCVCDGCTCGRCFLACASHLCCCPSPPSGSLNRYALRRTGFFPGLGWLLTRKLAMTLFPQVPATPALVVTALSAHPWADSVCFTLNPSHTHTPSCCIRPGAHMHVVAYFGDVYVCSCARAFAQWPNVRWDDWLRGLPSLKGKAVVIPEVRG